MKTRLLLLLLLGLISLNLVGCARSDSPAQKPEPKPPILAQVSCFSYGRGDREKVGYEGKIYNPNAFGLRNVEMTWKVYSTPQDANQAQSLKWSGHEEICSVRFEYLPPNTTYDFQTNKISARTEDVVGPLGIRPQAIRTDPPRINFTPDP